MYGAGVLSLIFFGLLAFCNAICHPFVHDDVIFILNNPHITELNRWHDLFIQSPAQGGLNTYWRPLLEIIDRLEYHFFGPHPFGYHFINVVIHVINGLLVFGLLQKLGLRQGLAWAIALLFLVHPVQTEAVSCISGISNLCMALGVLLALHAYLNKSFATALLCFLLAFLSKEQAVMFLPLIVVIDIYRDQKSFSRWSWWCLAVCAFLWLRGRVTGSSLIHDITVSPGEFYLRLAAIPRDIGMDIRLIFLPYDLHYYRSTDILQSNYTAWAVALIGVFGLIYVSKGWPQSRGTLILGLGWFVAALLPVLNIAPLISEYSFIMTPEHFLYLPIIGILIILAIAADFFIKRFRKPLFGLIVLICLLLTWHQNTFWRSEIALFERMLRFEPDFGRGHWLLAKAYSADGRFQEAEGHYERAFVIMSSYAKKATNDTAKGFYVGYLRTILYNWSLNERSIGKMSNSFLLASRELQQFIPLTKT